MSEPKPKKMVRRSVAIALGIICIILAASLVGALAILNTKSSQNTQGDIQSWTEGTFYFNLTSLQDINFTIPTAGFGSVTITINAWSAGRVGFGFQVFIGFMTANTTVDYQIYDAQSYPQYPQYPSVNPATILPPWWYTLFSLPVSFRQTYDVSFSNIMVWIWNNCTAFSTSPPIWGDVYYYLTM